MCMCHNSFRGSWQTPDSCRCCFSRCVGRKRPRDVSNSATCTNLRCLGPFVKLSSIYLQSWRLHGPSGHLLRVWPTSGYSVVSVHLARTTTSQVESASAGSNSLLCYCHVPLRRVCLCLLHALQLGSCMWQSPLHAPISRLTDPVLCTSSTQAPHHCGDSPMAGFAPVSLYLLVVGIPELDRTSGCDFTTAR